MLRDLKIHPKPRIIRLKLGILVYNLKIGRGGSGEEAALCIARKPNQSSSNVVLERICFLGVLVKVPDNYQIQPNIMRIQTKTQLNIPSIQSIYYMRNLKIKARSV